VALLELTLLGGFSAQSTAQQTLRISSRKNRALLAFLALTQGRRYARDKLVDLFWGDHDNEHGRNNLRQALAALRKDLTVIDPVTVEGEILSVPAAAVEVDVLAFERLSASDQVDDLKQAAALYRGDLLAGLALDESAFEEWLDPERRRIRELAVDVFTRLIPNLAAKEALETARRLVALDPLRESSHRVLIGLLAEQGDAELALKQYRLYAEALERELGLKPSAVAQALYKDISAGRLPKRETGEHLPAATNAVENIELRQAEKPSIAILPFENRSAESDHQFFCDSLSGEISDAISRLTRFRVVPWAETANYRGKASDLRAIGEDLGAAYVLQGSVHRLGERLRISIQLSDVGRDIHVWAEQFDGTARESFDIQDMIVRAIAASIETQMDLAGRHAAGTASPGALAVQDLVARGNALLYDETPENFAEAMALGEQAVALAPMEPRAHLLRAEAFVYGLAARVVEIDADKIAHGIELSQALLAMAPDLEWAHLVLARAYVEAGRLDEAIAASERALALNPNVSNGVARLGECYALQGRSAEALETCRLAIELNPRSPINYWRKFCIALAHFTAGDDGEALQEARGVLRWKPDLLRAAALIAASATALGLKAESDAAIAQCLARYPDLRASEVAPRLMPPFARPADRARLANLLRAAGLG
jgi:TolB-like protein/cytochrome c-type biogenesis protein CcmH/NrfG